MRQLERFAKQRAAAYDRLTVEAEDDLRLDWLVRTLADGCRRWVALAVVYWSHDGRAVPFGMLSAVGREGDDGGGFFYPPERRSEGRWFVSRIGDPWCHFGPGHDGIREAPGERRDSLVPAGLATPCDIELEVRGWANGEQPIPLAPWRRSR